jgi:tripeptidyl-peptidase-1
MTDPPKIFSISYGSEEQFMSLSTINSFNTEAMKLGVMGVTLLVASGDDGVGGRFVRSGALTCAYNPDFPTVSPYLTVVGATQMCFDIIVVFLSYQKTSNYVHSGS